MTMPDVIDLLRQALLTTALLVAPALVTALMVGIVTGVLQAITQVQDQTISYVPKLLAVAAALLMCLPWMIEHVVEYAREIITVVPSGF